MSKQTNYLSQDDLPLVKLLAKKHNKVITFIDLETNGLLKRKITKPDGKTFEVPNDVFAITEIGVLHVTPNGQIIESGHLICPDDFMSKESQDVTHIHPEMVLYSAPWKFYAPKLAKWMSDHIMVGYNSCSFDFNALVKVNMRAGYFSSVNFPKDVRSMYLRATNKDFGNKGKLTELAERYGVTLSGDAHRAGFDIALTALLMEKMLEVHGIDLFDHPDSAKNPDNVKRLKEDGSIERRAQKFQNEVLDFYIMNPRGNIQRLTESLGVDDKEVMPAIRLLLEEGVLLPEQIIDGYEAAWLKSRINDARNKAWKGASSGKYKALMNALIEHNPPFNLTYLHMHVALADNPIIESNYMDNESFHILDIVPWE